MGTANAGEESCPEAIAAEPSCGDTSCDGSSCDGAGLGCTAADDFLSAAVVWGAETAWAETPDLLLPGASFGVAASDAGAGAAAVEFGLRLEVKSTGLLLEVSLMRVLATANPPSGALAVWSATVVALTGRAGTVLAVVRRDVEMGSAAGFSGVGSMTLASLDLAAASGFALGGSGRGGATLLSLTGDCSPKVGIAAGAEATGIIEKMSKVGLEWGAGLGLSADEDAVWSGGPGSDDGATCASGAAGAGGAEVKNPAGAEGDCMVGDWSGTTVGTPVGTELWTWPSLSACAGETGTGGAATVENSAGMAWSCTGTLEVECASSEA